MLHWRSTSSGTCGSGLISSAKALRVNMATIDAVSGVADVSAKLAKSCPPHHRQLRLVGDERLLAVAGEANLDLAAGAVTADRCHPADAVLVVPDHHA